MCFHAPILLPISEAPAAIARFPGVCVCVERPH